MHIEATNRTINATNRLLGACGRSHPITIALDPWAVAMLHRMILLPVILGEVNLSGVTDDLWGMWGARLIWQTHPHKSPLLLLAGQHLHHLTPTLPWVHIPKWHPSCWPIVNTQAYSHPHVISCEAPSQIPAPVPFQRTWGWGWVTPVAHQWSSMEAKLLSVAEFKEFKVKVARSSRAHGGI